jgi:hypothetical protein
VADRHATFVVVPSRLLAYVCDIHPRYVEREVEVHVDGHVEVARDGEHAVDLAVRVAIDVRRRTRDARTALERCDHQLLGARIVGETFLGKYADVDVDCKGVLVHERCHAVEAAQADARIDFDVRAHVRRALQDRALERARAARVHVLRGERGLRPRDLANGFGQRPLARAHALQDARLVEVHVRLDEAR